MVGEAPNCNHSEGVHKAADTKLELPLSSAQTDRHRYRIIIDEAQCIKNRNSLSSKAAHELMATHRLVMTGTPMMNSIDELYPLLRFLKIKPYNDWSRFNQEIGKVRPRLRRARNTQHLLIPCSSLSKSLTLKLGRKPCSVFRFY